LAGPSVNNRIVGQLGRGGAGIVYKAVDETLGRDVAVKTLNPDLANTEVMERFRAEATILAKLNHAQIATIFELFRSENDLLMVMEFVRGETLDKLAERLGPFAPDRAAYLIDLILSALEYAHRAGVVHRDVKPANVMVTDEGGVKIMDFGIARVLGAEQKTVDFRLMGTPAYMSPEQVMGEEVDGRSDLYSVGVLFYRLLTGALPFSADTALGMLQRQIRDNPTPVHVHRPSCRPGAIRSSSARSRRRPRIVSSRRKNSAMRSAARPGRCRG
jgi:serine/threonine-protein kinase